MSDARRRLLLDLVVMIAAFAAATLIAEAAGAESLGVAMSFGQIGFALAAVYVVVKR